MGSSLARRVRHEDALCGIVTSSYSNIPPRFVLRQNPVALKVAAAENFVVRLRGDGTPRRVKKDIALLKCTPLLGLEMARRLLLPLRESGIAPVGSTETTPDPIDDRHAQSRCRSARAPLSRLRSSPDLSSHRHRRGEAGRAMGLLPVRAVRILRIPIPDPQGPSDR